MYVCFISISTWWRNKHVVSEHWMAVESWRGTLAGKSSLSRSTCWASFESRHNWLRWKSEFVHLITRSSSHTHSHIHTYMHTWYFLTKYVGTIIKVLFMIVHHWQTLSLKYRMLWNVWCKPLYRDIENLLYKLYSQSWNNEKFAIIDFQSIVWAQ